MTALRRLVIAVSLGWVLVGCSAAATPRPTATPTRVLSTPAPTPAASAPGAEIGCDLGGHDGAYHIHSLVAVKVNGALHAPPANIGIGTDCMYWVHTHDTDGIVHIEAPANVSPTLGDFMTLWGSSFPDDPTLAEARAAIAAGEVTIDDQPTSGNPLDVVLADKMRIILGS